MAAVYHTSHPYRTDIFDDTEAGAQDVHLIDKMTSSFKRKNLISFSSLWTSSPSKKRMVAAIVVSAAIFVVVIVLLSVFVRSCYSSSSSGVQGSNPGPDGRLIQVDEGVTMSFYDVYDLSPSVEAKHIQYVLDNVQPKHVHRFMSSEAITDEDVRLALEKHGLDAVTASPVSILRNTGPANDESCEQFNSCSRLQVDPIRQEEEDVRAVSLIGSPQTRVVGKLVYVSYGTVEDLEFVNRSVDLGNDSIALVRASTNTSMAKVAQVLQAYGFKGAAFYPDAKDYIQGFPLPHPHHGGPRAMPPSEFELPQGWGLPGNTPLMGSVVPEPGWPDLTIPCVSIPSAPAFHLLRMLRPSPNKTPPPEGFKGSFNVPYDIGPGFKGSDRSVVIQARAKWDAFAGENIFGFIRGDQEPDRFLLIGAFRSSASLSKTAGASEKSALGHLFELARVFGKLKSLGWRPHRSLVFAVWASQDSAAEFQHGMDAYLSRNLPDLKDQLVAYLHVDSPVVSGATSLNVLADALLRESLYEAAKKIPHHDPTRPSHSNFYESWLSSSTVEVVVPGQLFDSAWMKDHLRDLTRSNAYHQVYPRVGVPDGCRIKGLRRMIREMQTPVLSMRYVDKRLGNYVVRNTEEDTLQRYLASIDVPEEVLLQLHGSISKLYALVAMDMLDSALLKFSLVDVADEIEQGIMGVEDTVKNATLRAELTHTLWMFSSAAGSFHLAMRREAKWTALKARGINEVLRGVNQRLLPQLQEFVDASGEPRLQTNDESCSPLDFAFMARHNSRENSQWVHSLIATLRGITRSLCSSPLLDVQCGSHVSRASSTGRVH